MDRSQIDKFVSGIFGPSAPRPKKKAALDLSEVPSADARAGRMAPDMKEATRTWSDTGRDVEAILRDIATAQPEALVKAFEEPGIDTATNAAVQTAMLVGKPLAAAKAAGVGLGLAGLDDLGVFGGEAAASDTDPLGASRARFDKLQKKKSLSRAEREEQNSYLKILQDAQAAKIEAEKARSMAEDAAKQGEFDRSVKNAEAVRDQELSRVRRFSDTEVGKVFEEMGGFAPVVGGAGAGALTRAAMGPAKGMLGKAAPALTGATAGITALNVPLAYNAFMTEPDNPEKAAYTAYARELPPEHPRKGEWNTYAEGLPAANPVREQASAELYDPYKLAERALFGAVEGGLGGQIGKEAIDVLGRGFNAARNQSTGAGGPTASLPGSQPMPAVSAPVPQPVKSLSPYAGTYKGYPSLPSEVRGDLRGMYADDVAASGSIPGARKGAADMKQMLADLGISGNVPEGRVSKINQAVQSLATQLGRWPTRDEIMGLFNDKTLAVPLTAGAGAAALSDAELQAMLAEIMGGGN